MIKYIGILKKAVRNKVLYYIFSRYATYFIQFINSLFIADYLGPYYLGVWGFITLIIQYLNQFNLGIAYSANAIISVHKNKEWYVQKVIGTALTMLMALSIFVFSVYIFSYILNFNFGDKYHFSQYAPLVLLIGVLGYFNSLFSNIFRVYGKLAEIAFSQSIFPVLMLLVILLFKTENLLWGLVRANLLAFLLSFCLYIIKTPVKLKPVFIRRLIKTIQIKGWYLFVYNTSFYLIVISTRSLISEYYKVEEFGYFTFAFALSNAILLLLQSFSFIIFPKLLNRFASSTSEKVVSILNQVRDAYITTSHLLIHGAILVFPLFLLLFPQYKQASDAFKLIALTVVLYTNGFGYSGFLIAREKEKQLGYLSFTALILNIFIAIVFIKVFHVAFSFVIISTMITYFIYVFLLCLFGRKKLKLKTSFLVVFKDAYPIRLFIPYITSLVLILLTAPYFYFIIPVILFLILNYKVLLSIKQLARTIVLNPNFINI